MFSSIPVLRTELQALLAAALPEPWEIVPDLAAANVSLVPAVYIEFQKLDTTLDGQPLGRGTAAASVDLVLVDPRTADGIAETAIEEELVPLLHVLDEQDDIGWSSATKIRLDNSGQFGWRISTVTLVTT